MAGIIMDFVWFPLLTIKSRIQAANKSKIGLKVSATNNIYKGILCNILVSFPNNCLFFLSYDFYRNISKKYHKNNSLFLDSMFGSIFGEITSSVLKIPFEKLRLNMQIGFFKSIK